MKIIEKIQIRGLWNQFNLEWRLSPRVNILSGGNGTGKSTLLSALGELFATGQISSRRRMLMDRIVIKFTDGSSVSTDTPFDPAPYNVELISTFDALIKDSESLQKISPGALIATELDLELYKLQNGYLGYQIDVGNRVIEMLTQGASQSEIAGVTSHKTLYFDTLDKLFSGTGKKIDRHNKELRFMIDNSIIDPYQLSSGEKQILIILTKTLIQNQAPHIMIMDEPEISLHFDWQKRLIEYVILLNPNLQLIVATHSPAMVMDGWVDCVSEISDLKI